MDEEAGTAEGLPALIDEALGRDLPETGRSALRRFGSYVSHRAGRIIAWQGEIAERCYFLLSGSVRPLKHRIGAADIVLPIATRGDWICLAEMVSSSPVLADQACASDCALLSFGARNFALLRGTPGIETWVSLCLAREATSLGGFLAEGGPMERIASFLLSRRKRAAGIESSSVSVTQAEIAVCLGLTRETVNKRLAELESRGIVETSRGSLRIPDWSALEEILRAD
jgi:CRP-like cAMP-binding protein